MQSIVALIVGVPLMAIIGIVVGTAHLVFCLGCLGVLRILLEPIFESIAIRINRNVPPLFKDIQFLFIIGNVMAILFFLYVIYKLESGGISFSNNPNINPNVVTVVQTMFYIGYLAVPLCLIWIAYSDNSSDGTTK